MDWDVELFYAINSLAGRSSFFDLVMVFLSSPGNLYVPGFLAFAYWFWANRREALIGSASLAALIGLSDFLGAQVKHLVARPRPCQLLERVHEVVGCGGAFSFPSNHAVNTAAAATFFQVLYPTTGWISWPLVVLIGFGRVYLGGHYITDVLGGWGIGALGGFAAGFALTRWQTFRPSRARPESASVAKEPERS